MRSDSELHVSHRVRRSNHLRLHFLVIERFLSGQGPISTKHWLVYAGNNEVYLNSTAFDRADGEKTSHPVRISSSDEMSKEERSDVFPMEEIRTLSFAKNDANDDAIGSMDEGIHLNKREKEELPTDAWPNHRSEQNDSDERNKDDRQSSPIEHSIIRCRNNKRERERER